MITKYIPAFFVLALCIIVLTGLTDGSHSINKSAGAPAGTAGAPSEQSCATAGCHDQFALNSGNASINFTYNSGVNTYFTGKKYNLNVTINDSAKFTKFGFQVVALKNSDTSLAGKLSLTDAIRTQILIPNSNSPYFGKEYVTHTLEGTGTSSPGNKSWSFNWTAPSNFYDTITFYLAVNSSDNDGEMVGDYIYTRSIAVTYDPSLSIQDKSLNKLVNANIYPNPAKGNTGIFYELKDDGYIEACIISVDGKKITDVFAAYRKQGIHEDKIIFPESLTQGLYIFKLKTEDQVVIKKILIL